MPTNFHNITDWVQHSARIVETARHTAVNHVQERNVVSHVDVALTSARNLEHDVSHRQSVTNDTYRIARIDSTVTVDAVRQMHNVISNTINNNTNVSRSNATTKSTNDVRTGNIRTVRYYYHPHIPV